MIIWHILCHCLDYFSITECFFQNLWSGAFCDVSPSLVHFSTSSDAGTGGEEMADSTGMAGVIERAG